MARMAIRDIRPVNWILRMPQRLFDYVEIHELGVVTLDRIPWCIPQKLNLELRLISVRNLSASTLQPRIPFGCLAYGLRFDRLCITAMLFRDFVDSCLAHSFHS